MPVARTSWRIDGCAGRRGVEPRALGARYPLHAIEHRGFRSGERRGIRCPSPGSHAAGAVTRKHVAAVDGQAGAEPASVLFAPEPDCVTPLHVAVFPEWVDSLAVKNVCPWNEKSTSPVPASHCGKVCAYPLTAPSGSVICCAPPPSAGTCQRPELKVGTKMIRLFSHHAPPHGRGAGAMMVAAPPATGARQSLPPAKNAMNRPSGEKMDRPLRHSNPPREASRRRGFAGRVATSSSSVRPSTRWSGHPEKSRARSSPAHRVAG